MYRFSGRLRWPTKVKLVRRYGGSPRRHLPYVLWDPEVESFTYELENEDELAACVAAAFELPVERVLGWIDEVHHDPELSSELARRVRRRPWLKQRMQPGTRMLWYVLARHLRPSLVVETGIYDGLGSLVLLRALARNAVEGHPGELLSIDDVALSGELVPDHLAGPWTKLVGRSDVDLELAIADRRVGLLLQDTPHTERNQRTEFGIALRHADETLVLVEASRDVSPTLNQLARHLGSERHVFTGQARQHPATTPGTFLIIHADELSRGVPEPWDERPPQVTA